MSPKYVILWGGRVSLEHGGGYLSGYNNPQA